jgi:exonuclease III
VQRATQNPAKQQKNDKSRTPRKRTDSPQPTQSKRKKQAKSTLEPINEAKEDEENDDSPTIKPPQIHKPREPEPERDKDEKENNPTRAKRQDVTKALQYARNVATGFVLNNKPKLPQADAPTQQDYRENIAERVRGQDAMDRLVAATSGHEAAAKDYVTIAEQIATAKPGTADRQTLKAIMLLLHAVAADEDLISRSMDVCMTALLTGPSKRVASRARHGIQTMLERGGTRAYAALRRTIDHSQGIPEDDAQGVQSTINDWASQAATRLSQLPLTDYQWLMDMKRNDIPLITSRDSMDPKNGTAQWIMDEPPGRPKFDYTHMSWNANSFMKRLRCGDLSEMLKQNMDIDIIHITELRTAIKPDSLEAWELRRGLELLGFHHAVWNWCTDTPGTHGSAIISRIPIKRVTFGLENGASDPEGRTITTEFKDRSIIWTYTPCSAMYKSGTDERRHNYDTAFNEHYRAQKQKTQKPVFAAGDFNLAPRPCDSTIAPGDMAYIPSNKPFERENYFKLLLQNKLINVAEEFAKDKKDSQGPRRTWSKGKPGTKLYMAMRIDHVLCPTERFKRSTDATINYPAITDFSTSRKTYGSDHNANRFTISTKPMTERSYPQASAIVQRNPPKPRHLCRDCGEDFASGNQLHMHLKATTTTTGANHRSHLPQFAARDQHGPMQWDAPT